MFRFGSGTFSCSSLPPGTFISAPKKMEHTITATNSSFASAMVKFPGIKLSIMVAGALTGSASRLPVLVLLTLSCFSIVGSKNRLPIVMPMTQAAHVVAMYHMKVILARPPVFFNIFVSATLVLMFVSMKGRTIIFKVLIHIFPSKPKYTTNVSLALLSSVVPLTSSPINIPITAIDIILYASLRSAHTVL